ncbi:hypothetical protein MMC21_005382 [Puttea exsequens]|nr:hypothetical protein [Puttea exsequens]
MSFIARRGLTTLVPPKIASPLAIGGAKDAARMQQVVDLYEKLPKGPAPDRTAKGLLGRYQARYFGRNSSPAPFYHVIGALLLLGYANNYYFHLRHHKNNAH